MALVSSKRFYLMEFIEISHRTCYHWTSGFPSLFHLCFFSVVVHKSNIRELKVKSHKDFNPQLKKSENRRWKEESMFYMIWLRKFVKYMLLGLTSAIRITCKIYDPWAYECMLFPRNRKHQRNCEAWYAELQARLIKSFFQIWFRKIVGFYKLYCSSTNFIFVSFHPRTWCFLWFVHYNSLLFVFHRMCKVSESV